MYSLQHYHTPWFYNVPPESLNFLKTLLYIEVQNQVVPLKTSWKEMKRDQRRREACACLKILLPWFSVGKKASINKTWKYTNAACISCRANYLPCRKSISTTKQWSSSIVEILSMLYWSNHFTSTPYTCIYLCIYYSSHLKNRFVTPISFWLVLFKNLYGQSECDCGWMGNISIYRSNSLLVCMPSITPTHDTHHITTSKDIADIWSLVCRHPWQRLESSNEIS